MTPTAPRPQNLFADTLRLAAMAAALGVAFGLAPLAVESARAFETTHLRVGNQAYGATQNIELAVNKSMIVDLPAGVGEVVATQPSVATVVMRSKSRAIVQGVSGGDTNIFFLDQSARTISVLEGSDDADHTLEQVRRAIGKSQHRPPVIGITGTGGAGKSSLNDELLNRFVRHFPERQIAQIAAILRAGPAP